MKETIYRGCKRLHEPKKFENINGFVIPQEESFKNEKVRQEFISELSEKHEHYKFVDEYLRKQVPIDGATYWKELIDCYKEESKNA